MMIFSVERADFLAACAVELFSLTKIELSGELTYFAAFAGVEAVGN